MTEASLQALSVLRSTEHLQWYVVPLLVLILYIYIGEIERKNWGAILLGIYSFANGWILEMVNALVLHFTNYAALWSTPSNSSYVIYVGWNAEISGMVLRALGQDVTVSERALVSGQGASIQVERGCDAAAASALFVSAVLASPVPWLSKIGAAAVGTVLLAVLNLIRVMSLFLVRVYYPKAFDVMHLDVWQALFIFLAILFWAVWASQVSRRRIVQPDVSATRATT